MSRISSINTARIVHTFSLIFLGLAFASLPKAEQIQLSAAPSIVTSSNKSIGWGSHGMAVFGGREGLYASHLPMFHAPHDTQVIIRFHLQDQTIDAQLRNALAQKPELWTLDPEEFDLLQLAPGHPHGLKQFNARFVQGHFERGGKTRFLNQTAIIDEIVFFHRLQSAFSKHSDGKYHLIGTGVEHFLVKEIDRRPDFDLIIALAPINVPISQLPKLILLPTDKMETPTTSLWKKTLQQQSESTLIIRKLLYFDTEDLK